MQRGTVMSRMESILYPHQTKFVNSIRASFAQGNKKVVAQASTGYGKSVTAGHMITRALEKGKKRVVLIVDSLTLVDQLLETFENMFGLDVGVIQGMNMKTDMNKPVQIATPQTLARRFKCERRGNYFREYLVDLLIVDECHLMYQGTVDAMEYWNCPVIGFSATPYAKGMGLIYDSLVKAESLETLMERGDLAPYRAFSHESPDFSGIKVSPNGDIQASGAADKYDDGLIGDVFKTWNKDWNDRLTIGFAPTIAKCEAFAKLFRDKGIHSLAVHSKLNDEDSDQMISQFKTGDVRVLWSVAKLVKGFDVAEASCLIDCQPTHSLMRHCQKGGRVLRKHKDKEFAVILDHAGNMLRNGMFEDAGIDELSTKKKGEKDDIDRKKEGDPKPLTCAKCKTVLKKYTPECPSCGNEIVKQSKTDSPDEIGWADGELVEVTRKKANKELSNAEKASFYGQLKQMVKDRGNKTGYASWLYRERFGVWPNAYKDAPLQPMTLETASYVKHLQIRKSKGKGVSA